MSLLHFNGEKFLVEYYNDNSHLPVAISTFAKQTWWKQESGTDRSNLRDEPLDPGRMESFIPTAMPTLGRPPTAPMRAL